MRHYRRFERLLTGDFMVYLRASGKKSLPRQVSDLYRLYRTYNYLPYQYLKHGLYLKKFGDEIYRYLPTELLHVTRDAVNAGVDLALVEDKLLFEDAIRAAGMRTTNSLFRLKRGNIADMAGNRLSYPEFITRIEAMNLADGIIVKPLTGGSGSAIFKLHVNDGRLIHKGESLDDAAFNHLVFETNNGVHWTEFVIQETVIQHPALARFNPTSLNTVRIDTFIDNAGAVHFNAAALKVGMPGSIIDNTGVGGYMIAIDLDNGRLMTGAKREPQFGGLYHDVRETFGIDPSTFVMPFWSEMRDTMRLAARTLKPLRSIGWDVAITPNGPLIVEANENYGIDVLQELSGGYADKPLGLAYLEGFAPKKAPVLTAVNT